MIEYKTIDPKYDVESVLEQEGKKWWILSCIYNGFFIFWREKKEVTKREKKEVDQLSTRFFSMFKDWHWITRTHEDILEQIREKCWVNAKDVSGSSLLEEFSNYWMEKPDGVKKAKWEKQTTFELFARIRTWAGKSKYWKQDIWKLVEKKRNDINVREHNEEEEEKRLAEEKRVRLREKFKQLSKETQQEIQREAAQAIEALPMKFSQERMNLLIKWKMASIVEARYFSNNQ